ncbi:hypothetical protein GJ699_03555 [Duganella sp. FT80W]|uniref:Uncharacterized protein n=1 Tax=Duganella guangzhouensis TaxID=2666084 RepID=A0A6I2KTF2_9BURK|nr:hypothetical protein [Duganella guangzhouensis]MRW89053.1 hypothetical protein [Duganella guangzhouensis]
MAIIAEFAFYLFMEVLMYGLGRIVIPILTFGRARAMNIKEIATLFPRMQVEEGEGEGKLLVPEWMTAMIGVLTLTGLVMLYLALR